MKKKVKFITLGCKVNQYETNAMMQKFIKNGYNIVEEEPDICIINTCTVTNMSDRKSRQMLRRMKEKNKDIILVAVGCYVQVSKKELLELEEIDIVLGNNEKSNIVQYIEKFIAENKKEVEVEDIMQEKEFLDFGEVTFTEKTRAVIKIQDGCDRYCSYCIIPYARGRVRSRNKESIIAEVKENVKREKKEIVITGIHIASYGKDFKENYKLIDLLEELNEIEGLKRIRLGSIEPLLITKEFIERLKKLDKICHHFHLSLQSGCDETLKRMNRRYNTKQFEEIVKILRDTYEDVVLTTDIIVGFPGETDEEFNSTYNFLDKIKFYKMHVFKYSPRKGTRAAEMKNQISGEVKEKRSGSLIELSNKNQLEYNKKLIGKDIEVLFEENKDGVYQGYTQNYILVHCKNNNIVENTIRKACVKSASDECVEADILCM